MTESVAESRLRTTPKRSRRGRTFAPIVAAGAVCLLSACAGPYSALEPASEEASAVAIVWWAMMTFSLVITTAVVAAWWYATHRASSPLGPAAARRQALHIIIWGGLVLPTGAIVALLWFGLPAGARFGTADDAPWVVDVTARQWQWQISYPALPGREASNEIHIPAGTAVDFHLRSQDVIHGFWIPRLGGKIDAIPGRTNVWRLQADEPGTYHGLCAEYCGVGHASMQLVVIAMAPDEFEAWQAEPDRAAVTKTGPADEPAANANASAAAERQSETDAAAAVHTPGDAP